MIEVIIAAISAALGGVGGHLFTRKRTRSETVQNTVEAAETVSEMALRLLTEERRYLRGQIEELRQRVEFLEKENAELRSKFSPPPLSQ